MLLAALGGAFAATRLSSGGAGAKPRRAAAPAPASWRDPELSRAIASADQTVVGRRIVTVAANEPWIDTGLSIARGAHLWADTRADGLWTGNPRYFPFSDANGLPVYPGRYRVDAKAPVLSLIGFVGRSPLTPPEVSVPHPARSGGPGGVADPGFVEIGDTLSYFTPRTSGTIWLRNNDNTNYASDVGEQIVKVIVTTNQVHAARPLRHHPPES